MTGAVTIDLPQLSGVQSALDDKADAADLAAYAPINNPNLTGTVQVPTAATGENSLRAANTGWVTSKLASYAPINSPALTGTPTAPTPPASATGGEIMTAAAVNTKLTSNLANTAPSMVRTDGVSTAGSAATVSRSDHEHGVAAMSPDYKNVNAKNSLPSVGTSWTADRYGYVQIVYNADFSGSGVIQLTVDIDGVVIGYAVTSSSARRLEFADVYPIAKGQVVSMRLNGVTAQATHECFCRFIPSM